MKGGYLNALVCLLILLALVLLDDMQIVNSEAEDSDAECQDDVGERFFKLYPNGDGRGEGIIVRVDRYKDVNDVIFTYCSDITKKMIESIPKDDRNYDSTVKFLEQICTSTDKVDHGFRLINEYGVRLMDLAKDVIGKGEKIFFVPHSLHFVWPLIKTGNIIVPKNVGQAIPGKDIRLKQLTDSPRVFQVENFMSEEEINEILDNNKDKMTPSEVGFAGWKDSTRTSSTSWDSSSPAALAIVERTYKLLGMDYDVTLGNNMQVLKYEAGQWYKPHVDYFHEDSYENNKPVVNNGSNRFATMFVYFSTVEEGGHTVFPFSTTHEGYKGEKLIHDGTINSPGYIDLQEAYNCCNSSATTALRSKPVRGNAVLFYSQHADGRLDPHSLHGGCPPVSGIKWSGNVWIWNRPTPDKSKALDKKFAKAEHDAVVEFYNNNPHGETIRLVWDPTDGEEISIGTIVNLDNVDIMAEIKAGGSTTLNTFTGHVFHALDMETNLVKFTYVVHPVHIYNPKDKNKQVDDEQNNDGSEDDEVDDDKYAEEEKENEPIIVDITW